MVTAVVSLLFAGWRVAPRVRGTMEVLKLYRNAMRFRALPTTIVVEPDPARAAELSRTDPDYFPRPSGGVHRVARLGSRAAVQYIFLHGRRRPDGKLRLVKVSEEVGAVRQEYLLAWIGTPATVFDLQPAAVSTPYVFPSGPPGERPRLYAGQPDPIDPSRFTIKYEYSDRNGSIHCALKNEDTLSFECVEEPAKP